MPKKKKNVGFIVMKTSYDYDDERYHESDGGSPVKVFRDKKKAEQEMFRLMVEFFSDEDVAAYSEDLEGLMTDGGIDLIKELLPAIEIHEEVKWDGESVDENLSNILKKLVRNASPEQQMKIIDSIQMSPFTLEEVELEE